MCNAGLRQALIELVACARLREGVSGQANPATEMGAVDARKGVSQAPAQRLLVWYISLLVQYFPRLFGIPKGRLDFFSPSSSRFWATGLKHQPVATRRSDPVHQRGWGVGAPALLCSPVGAHARGHGPSLREPPAISALPRRCPGGAAGSPPAAAGNAKGRGERRAGPLPIAPHGGGP